MKFSMKGTGGGRQSGGADVPGLHRAGSRSQEPERGQGLVVHGVRLRSLKQRNPKMIASRVMSLKVISDGDVVDGEEVLAAPGSATQYPIEVRLKTPAVVTAYMVQTSESQPGADPVEWTLQCLATDNTTWVDLHKAYPPQCTLPEGRGQWSEVFRIMNSGGGEQGSTGSGFEENNNSGLGPKRHSIIQSGDEDGTYLVGVESQESHRKLYQLLCEKSLKNSILNYKQEDVTCSSIKGTLLIVSPRDSKIYAYIIWAPYCLLMAVNPDLLSDKAKSSMGSMDALPILPDDDTEMMYEGPFRVEWKQACVVPDCKFLSLKKDNKVFGDKSVTLTSSPDADNRCLRHTHGPFYFRSRGFTSFCSELAKFLPIQQTHDDKLWALAGFDRDSEGSPLNNDSFGGGLGGLGGMNETVPTPTSGKKKTWVSNFLENRSKEKEKEKEREREKEQMPPSPQPPASPGIREEDEHHDVNPSSLFLEADEYNDRITRGESLKAYEWRSYFDSEGRLSEGCWREAKKKAFKGGIAEEVRKEVWQYLMRVYKVGSTEAERKASYAEQEKEYNIYLTQWQSITEEQKAMFAEFRDRLARVEKDVVRTDRAVDLFAEDNGEGQTVLHNILVTYSFYNFDLGYCQGMSDVVATIYHVFRNEVEAFTGFKNLMKDRMEVCFQRDQSGIAANLRFIGELTVLVEPELIKYLEGIDALNFYFCFRWIVVYFKREFNFYDVIKLWDVIWTCPFGDDYQLLLATCLLRMASSIIVGRKMTFDEILKFINDMSQQIPLNYLLRKADELYDELKRNHPSPNPSLRDLVEQAKLEAEVAK
eukprot:TRINITY_DN6975_c1_g1_i1.p1 TRINITY_DN6975_c1_g1~~TRINITY_DN6975_c1_g1_i1.p1  ORF type:complete len:817 (+),score=154.79 TRINITY_DN6975_c1_g1_i1:113-2563(+)